MSPARFSAGSPSRHQPRVPCRCSPAGDYRDPERSFPRGLRLSGPASIAAWTRPALASTSAATTLTFRFARLVLLTVTGRAAWGWGAALAAWVGGEGGTVAD